MKVWKLVSGILSIILSVFVVIQSGAAGMVNAMEGNGEVSGSAGLLVAVFLLAGGITSIATRKGGRGGSIAVAVLFLLAALIGFTLAGNYADLQIWAGWCLICGVLSLISVFGKKSKKRGNDA